MEAIQLNELQHTLSEALKSGSGSNPAMNSIINSYVWYHAILVIVGGCLVFIFACLSIIFWAKSKKTPKISQAKWGFEKKVYFSFGILNSVVAFLIILIVVINASTVLNPLHGFSFLVE